MPAFSIVKVDSLRSFRDAYLHPERFRYRFYYSYKYQIHVTSGLTCLQSSKQDLRDI